jgi:hypothetical protein
VDTVQDLTPRSLDLITLLLQHLCHHVPVISLNFDCAVFHGSAGAAFLFELLCEIQESIVVQGIPVMTVTPFPLRPFVSIPTLTMPSLLGSAFSRLHAHCETASSQSGHILPCSVE